MFKKRKQSNLRQRCQDESWNEGQSIHVETNRDELRKRKLPASKVETATTVNHEDSITEVDYSVVDDSARAFSGVEVDVDPLIDHRAILERNADIASKLAKGELEAGIYRGLGAGRTALQVREGAIASGKTSGLFGPVRGSHYARTTMRIDYNPEICKDYKETGYCGFGDTCKFLHDRSDYKAGWQLEKEWEAAQKKIQEKKLRPRKASGQSDSSASESEDSSDEDDDLPFACMICRKPWALSSRPIRSKCNHCFCESCAMERYAKEDTCAVCGAKTQGAFNVAEDILARVNEKSQNAGEKVEQNSG